MTWKILKIINVGGVLSRQKILTYGEGNVYGSD